MMAINQKNKDPWHFSHLGEKYFLRISNIVESLPIRNATIEELYIGCTGVEYAEIHNGRQINPNWCVKMKNGKEFRFGTTTGNILEVGQWDRNRCIQIKWTKIVDFYNSK